MLWPWLKGITSPAAIKVITVGDTIPKQLYQLLGRDENNELQGNAILLDFWECCR